MKKDFYFGFLSTRLTALRTYATEQLRRCVDGGSDRVPPNFDLRQTIREAGVLGKADGTISNAESASGDPLGVAYAKRRELCRHLFRDFITPIERRDLFSLSEAVIGGFEAFSSLKRVSAEEGNVLLSCVCDATDLPFELNPRESDRFERVFARSGNIRASDALRCYTACLNLCRERLIVAISNA